MPTGLAISRVRLINQGSLVQVQPSPGLSSALLWQWFMFVAQSRALNRLETCCFYFGTDRERANASRAPSHWGIRVPHCVCVIFELITSLEPMLEYVFNQSSGCGQAATGWCHKITWRGRRKESWRINHILPYLRVVRVIIFRWLTKMEREICNLWIWNPK